MVTFSKATCFQQLVDSTSFVTTVVPWFSAVQTYGTPDAVSRLDTDLTVVLRGGKDG